MGVEYVINIGGPEIEGYTNWLKEHNYSSPIRRGYEKKLDTSISDVNPLLVKKQSS